MKKFTPQQEAKIYEILTTPYDVLLCLIKEKDIEEKEWLVNAIEFYKKVYKAKGIKQAKDIVDNLSDLLQAVNKRIRGR